MNLVYLILVIITAISGLFFFHRRIKRDIHIFQLNSYRPNRYFKWLKTNYLFSVTMLFEILVLLAVSFLDLSIYLLIFLLIFIGIKLYFLVNLKEKKPLVITDRVKRLWGTVLVICLIILLIVNLFFFQNYIQASLITIIFFGILSSTLMLLANFIMKPVESYINTYYINDAKKILKQRNDLTIIAITGSYGKTSIKNFLFNILSTEKRVLITPGSYNTTLGVVRTIREYLKPYHEIFVVEMGAKQVGDIKEICEIVNHDIAILSSIGNQHLDTFKSIDNVIKTKFEIVEYLKDKGLAVLNFANPYIAVKDLDPFRNKTIVTHSGPASPWQMSDHAIGHNGVEFTVTNQNDLNARFRTKILGDHNLENILTCIIAAYHVGISIDNIKFGVSTLKPVKHRLEVISRSGITILDDSFNSNPLGALNALKVLHSMKGKTKIIVTPGMIELDEEQYDENFKLGENIAQYADVAIIVGTTNRKAILGGIENESFKQENIYVLDSLSEVRGILDRISNEGDVVLYENDLPDSYN